MEAELALAGPAAGPAVGLEEGPEATGLLTGPVPVGPLPEGHSPWRKLLPLAEEVQVASRGTDVFMVSSQAPSEMVSLPSTHALNLKY